jgi:hypothetical protein
MNKPGRYRVDDMPNSDISGNDTAPIPPIKSQPTISKKKPWLRIAIIVVIALVLVGGVLYFCWT